VKDILRLPILFVFLFLLLFLLFFALSVLALWGSVYSEGREAALRVVEADIPRILVRVLPAAVVLSLTLLLARIAGKPGSRFLSLLVSLAGAFVLLAFGYQVLSGLGQAEGAQPGEVEPTTRRYLVSGVFNETGSKVVYLEEIDGQRVSPVVVAEQGSANQKLLYFPQGRVETEDDSLILGMPGYILAVDPDPVFGVLFAEGPELRRFFRDLDFLNRELRGMFGLSLSAFYFAVLTVVIAAYGTGMFFRLTRWHLLNAALALLTLRGMLALFRFMKEDVVFELEKVLENPQALQFMPELVLLVLGGLLILLDLLFVPLRRGEEG
jgi:hypothetical protein